MKTSKDSALLVELREVLNGLVGKTCWNIAAGVNTGSHVSFDFGKKVRRTQALRNPYVSQDVRWYTGEVVLFVACSWRLDSEEEVLCGSEDDNSEAGPMMRGISYLGRPAGKICRSWYTGPGSGNLFRRRADISHLL